MTEPKTKCTDCGAAILRDTADHHDGRCVPCYRKAAAIPPASFHLARDIAETLVALDYDPTQFREMAWQEGADFVRSFIDKLEERDKLYRKWAPRLRTFAAKCRAKQLPPIREPISDYERAQQRIYEMTFRLTKPRPSQRATVAICSMPSIAVPVAQRVWPAGERIVLLTANEERQWSEIYSHPEDAFRWFERYWWYIEDSSERALSLADGRTFTLQNGERAWLVNVGQSYGPLAGRGHSALWCWDGRQARFIENVSAWIS